MKKLNLLFLFLSSILFGNNFELTKEEIDYLNSKKIISMRVDIVTGKQIGRAHV